MLHNATKEDLEQLQSEWVSVCSHYGDDGSVFASDLMAKISLMTSNIEGKEFFAYIVKSDDGKNEALLDVIQALPNSQYSWLKLYDMTITPEYVLNGTNLESLSTALAAAIIQPIDLLFNESHGDVKELKIYARTQNMIELFKAMVSNKFFNESFEKLSLGCSLSGQWLVFRKK